MKKLLFLAIIAAFCSFTFCGYSQQPEITMTQDDIECDIVGYDYADEAPYPENISFEKFASECKYVAGNLGFRLQMEDASFGRYSSFWENDEQVILSFDAVSLAINLDWQIVHAQEAEIFERNGRAMAFMHDIIYDEELGTSSKASFLIIELKDLDALMTITLSSEKSADDMLQIFSTFKL